MKKIISVLLLASMLASLAACGDNDNDKDKSNNNDTDVQAELPAGIEKKEYKEDFTILVPEWGLYNNYFFSDDTGTDAMSKALYERELTVEDHLGVTISTEWIDDIHQLPIKVREVNMSGDDLYQLVLTHCISGVSGMVTDNLLVDMNTIDTMNFDADYYNHIANENLAVKGHQYYAISDFMLPDPNAILFNKDMIAEHNLEDPYELVRNGEWTIDKMMEMMAVVSKDTGNGRRDKDDIYGLGTPADWYLCDAIYSSGLMLVEKNDEGDFELAIDKGERVYTMIEKYDALLNNFSTTYVYDHKDVDTDNHFTIDKEQSLFGITAVNQLNLLRDAEVEFGILPYPKLDETQDGYYALDWSGLMCIPASAQNLDMIGEVIELLSYYSDDAVIPAYFDIMLGEKLSRDAESREMLSIIFDNTVFDAGMNYFGFTGNMYKLFFMVGHQLAIQPTFSLSSFLATYAPGARAELQEFNEAVAE